MRFAWALLALLLPANAERLYAQAAAQTQNPAFARVQTMLGNLATELEEEQATDDQVFTEFHHWCESQTSTTTKSIEVLRGTLEELSAALTGLHAQKQELSTRVNDLNGQIEVSKSQIADAQDKRTAEKDSFVQEQQDFDNSIAACAKAVEILKLHYGDGSPPENTRPAWMGLLEVKSLLTKASVTFPEGLEGLIQTADAAANPGFFGKKPTSHDTYEGKTDEGLGIVGQLGVLQQTFMDDKQSAIDEENRLQEAFQTLMTEKTAQLQALVSERDVQQSTLNEVSQEIGEKEAQKANLEQELRDEEAYLASVQQQCKDGELMHQQRSQDRADERAAVAEAIRVLSNSEAAATAVSFRQQAVSGQFPPASFLQVESMASARPCRQCPQAAALLANYAKHYGSELLMTAAAVTGNAALQDVINSLTEMLRRLDEESVSEKAHKEWCDSELADTNAKKNEHQELVDQLSATIADLTEEIEEKKQGIADNEAATKKADEQFTEQSRIRGEEQKEYSTQQAHYKDAIEAITQAAEIIEKALGQQAAAFMQAQQAPPPQFGAYANKGAQGGQVVQLLGQVKQEFSQGMADSAAMEARAQQDFQTVSTQYEAARRDLLDAKDSLSAQFQAAQEKSDQASNDLEANQQEVQSAADYLGKLGASCGTLLAHFDARAQMRQEERQAITEAISVLSAA